MAKWEDIGEEINRKCPKIEVMIEQLCNYTKSHWLILFEWQNQVYQQSSFIKKKPICQLQIFVSNKLDSGFDF